MFNCHNPKKHGGGRGQYCGFPQFSPSSKTYDPHFYARLTRGVNPDDIKYMDVCKKKRVSFLAALRQF